MGLQKYMLRKNIGKVLFFLALCLTLILPLSSMTKAEQKLEDGEYSIGLDLEGGSGKASVETPTLFLVKNRKYYVKLTWSSSNYDYMIVDGIRYENESEPEVNSSFTIPVKKLDSSFFVIADTLAMGEPREIQYEIICYSDSIGSKGALPQESAKRVLIMAAIIIVIGGILNHYVKKKRSQDFVKR